MVMSASAPGVQAAQVWSAQGVRTADGCGVIVVGSGRFGPPSRIRVAMTPVNMLRIMSDGQVSVPSPIPMPRSRKRVNEFMTSPPRAETSGQ